MTNQDTIEIINQIIATKQGIADEKSKQYTLEQEAQALERIKNAFISVVSKPQPTLRKEQPSIESMLQELKKSDSYLMSNPYNEEYESVFDK